ncbi:MAG TPA: hypothetical protein VN648_16915, partial [Candidatus Methylomirabilis sp.]|nr:hypothetical protein [Candidatus Methylomirabilis sp.]
SVLTSGCNNLTVGLTTTQEMRYTSEHRVWMLGAQLVEAFLHQAGDLAIAVFHDLVVFGLIGCEDGPVKGRQELDGDRCRQGQRGGENGVHAEWRSQEDRKDFDAQTIQPEDARQALTTREDHDRVMGSVGNHWDDRDRGAKRELHKPPVCAELDTVSCRPRPTCLVIPTRVDQYECTL